MSKIKLYLQEGDNDREVFELKIYFFNEFAPPEQCRHKNGDYT